jgi:hypothetical protein
VSCMVLPLLLQHTTHRSQCQVSWSACLDPYETYGEPDKGGVFTRVRRILSLCRLSTDYLKALVDSFSECFNSIFCPELSIDVTDSGMWHADQ